jgi:trigger factor
LNIQTERLDNHLARFTVELEVARLEQAKQQAARKLSQKYNIPGFRKGKAPYKIIQQFFGDAPIVEDAIEILSNDLYKQVLDESGVEPYGPGQLEDFKVDPPSLIFVVPMQPTVNLGDYRSVRMDFHVPQIEDEQVDRAMRQLREDNALYEESREAVAPGNRVTMELYAKLIEDDKAETEATEHTHAEDKAEVDAEAHSHEAGEEHDHDHDHDHGEDHGLGGEEFIHEHEAVMILGEDNEEPAPGFRQAVFGAALDEEREFGLEFPSDEEEYSEFSGKRANFKVKIKKIEIVTLPAMNDDLAARLTEKEETPLTLLQLRIKVREDLQKAAEQQAKSNYAGEVLDVLVERATVAFPQAMVDDQTETYLERLDQDFRRQGLTLEDYMRIANKERDALKADYHDIAIKNLKRALVLREIRAVEKIDVSEAAIDGEITKMMGRFGAQAESLRSVLDTPHMRESIQNDLMEQGTLDRIVAIAKGEAPPLDTPVVEATITSQEA